MLRFLLLCPCVSYFPLSDLGSSQGVLVFDVLAHGGAVAVQVKEHEKFKPRCTTCIAFRVGMGPLPLHQETMDLFVKFLTMPKPVFSLDSRRHFQGTVRDGVFSFIAYVAVALYPHVLLALVLVLLVPEV